MTTHPLPLPLWAARALAEGRRMQWRVPLKVQPTLITIGEASVDTSGVKPLALFRTVSGYVQESGLPFTTGDIFWAQEAEKAVIHRTAARRIEKTWRRKMAVSCPHCSRGILPTDVPIEPE